MFTIMNRIVSRFNALRLQTLTRRCLATEKAVDKRDKPFVYSESKAYKYKASETFRVTEEDFTYNPHTKKVINFSLAIFLIYFCFLRQPNETDEILSKGLFELVPQLEIPLLEVEVKKLESSGSDATEIKKKIEQLKAQQS